MAVANNNTVDSLALVVGNTQVETPVVIAPSAIRHDQLMYHDLPTLTMLKKEMSDLRYSKKKPKQGGWDYSTASKKIDNWVIDTSLKVVLSVHQLMIFLQAYSYSYAQEEMRKFFFPTKM